MRARMTTPSHHTRPNEHMRGTSVADLFNAFRSQPLPDALDAWRWRINQHNDDVSGLAQYALSVLDEVGEGALREIFATHDITVGRLSTSGMFWLSFTRSELTDAEAETLLAVETALNRLVLVNRVLTDLVSTSDEATCRRADWACLRAVADQAPALLAEVTRANPLADFHGAYATHGGEWDVRSRFAHAIEHSSLPYRTDYRFDVDVVERSFSIDFAVPTARMLPGRPGLSMAPAYALRAAVVYAAGAFGTSLRITHVTVTAHEASSEGAAVASLRFKRDAFIGATMAAVDDGRAADARYDTDLSALVSLVACEQKRLKVASDGTLAPIDPLGAFLGPQPPIAFDARTLPPEATALLCADTVRELDVMSPQDEDLQERIEQARADALDSPLLAIAQLEDVVADCIARQVLPQDNEIPLYCLGTVERYLVSLAGFTGDQRFVRAPDALFAARIDLARLLRMIGDLDRSLAQAQAALELAPTSTLGYLETATTLGALGSPDTAIDVLRRGMRLCYLPDSLTFMDYRLAYLLWSAGKTDVAIAAYVLALDDDRIGAVAARELAEAMAEVGMAERPSREAAAQTLAEEDFCTEANPEIIDLMGRLAVILTDADLTCAARPALLLVSTLERNDAIGSIASSLHTRD